jgi:hypothetical protein
LSGVDESVIVNILNGTAAQPYPAPLDCITADLIYLRNKISHIINDVVPEIAAKKEPFTGKLLI